MRNTNKSLLLSIFGFLVLALVIDVISADDYVAIDKIFLNCGAPPESTDDDNRKWTSDIGSKFALASGRSLTSTAATQKPSVPMIPYMTARVFQSSFTYSFPVTPGRKFIRLHFYPASYNNLNASNALFSVTTGAYTLLRNFSAFQTADALNFDYMFKEYSVYEPSVTLNVTFAPAPNAPNSFAFVNGIEVVSHPDIYNTADGTVSRVGLGVPFIIDNNTALENVYRFNVGGGVISPSADTGLFRQWLDDTPYLSGAAWGVVGTPDPGVNFTYPAGRPSYVAPLDVYKTARSMGPDPNINKNYNLTWRLLADPGFSYLVRLHFCEISEYISLVNQRVFDIFLNNRTAFDKADVIAWAGHNGVPYYKDFVVFIPSGSSQQDIWLALHPDIASKPQYYDAILNGLEVFKVSTRSGNLAGLNPIKSLVPYNTNPDAISPPGSGQSNSHKAAAGGGVRGGIAALLLVGLFVCFVSHRRRHRKDYSTSDGPSGWPPLSLYGNSHSSGSAKTNTTGSYASSLPSNLYRHFSFSEIKAATKNFD